MFALNNEFAGMLFVILKKKLLGMKHLLLLIAVFSLTFVQITAQTKKFSEDFKPVRTELTKWDPIRGEWLASSLEAISTKQPIPDRTFPEELTPMDMLRLVPEQSRTSVRGIVSQNQSVSTDSTGRKEWNTVSSLLDRTSCKPVSGRTYGDPHLSSFDGASYSFQTVGEFVLAKSEASNFEIQARQQPQSEDFSLNTAVAMNVGGDRVCIYANEKPDNDNSSALRVDGRPVSISRSTYYLPHGGTIRYSSNSYLVTWPSGESATIEMRHSARMNFLNVSVQVYPCIQRDLTGLLGNGNGRESDDFDVDNGARRPAYMAFSSFGNDQLEKASNEAEKEYLAFLARDFARGFRVTQQTSLFDYGMGQSTLSFTDETFPRVHRTIGDLSNDRQIAARRNCEERGITGPDLKGCIYDNAYLEIPPSPRPAIIDPTNGVVLGQIDKPAPNVNPERIGKVEGTKDPIPDKTPQTLEKPQTQEVKPEKNPGKVNNTIFKPTEKPVEKPGSSKPEIIKPKPAPVIKPSGTVKPSGSGTTVKPSPTPIKTTPIIKGKGK